MNHRTWTSAALVVVASIAGLLAATLAPVAPAAAADGSLGSVTAFEHDGDVYEFAAGQARVRISVLDDGVLRVEAAPDGIFTDPANDPPSDPAAPDARIIVGDVAADGGSTFTESADAVVIEGAAFTLTVHKSPLTLSLADADGQPLWDEVEPLAFTAQGATQSLSQGADEQFFGGGMQNGRFSHRDTTIQIARDYNWNEGGNPNAVPFYVSSNGYAVLRDTFAPGTYAFGSPVTTTHQEQRFDAFYMVGDTRQVLDDYTQLTGRPALVPMYALEVGDADCYLHNANRGERETLRDAQAIAEGYVENEMPLGWMLVNDGYGCGYEQLPETADMLNANGMELGLWTESDLTEQEYEVTSGVRVRKTDVAWVGPGYRFALDACEQSSDGIQDYSADRSTVLTIEGWAGTQRCAAVWSGDQYGTWDYIRWQIPTYAGSTMSGQHLATGDIDGIFGGSAQTYVRDLQWKMFLPMTYTMSGWASSDKQPWRYGSPYTEINRRYLQLHERLLPYFYTHVAAAHATGLGPTRPLYVNYPDDPTTWGDAVAQQFLAGDDFLVAPVYEDATERDGIYLPEGTWVDYWSGQVYEGPQTIDDYPAPLDVLPVFVRAGAIVPMFPEGTLDWQQGVDSGQLDLDIYPQGSSSFTAYSDDGRSQAALDGASAEQVFDVTAPTSGLGRVQLKIGSLDGEYEGKPTSRTYGLTFHTDQSPGSVKAGSTVLAGQPSLAALEAAASGWFFDSATGIVHVKTAPLATDRDWLVTLGWSSAVGGRYPADRNAAVDLQVDAISEAGVAGTVQALFTNRTGVATKVESVTVTAPDGWTVTPQGPTSATRLAAGATFTATFDVTPPADAAAGAAELSTHVQYRPHTTSLTVSDRASTTLAYDGLTGALNNVGITASADPGPGDIDGGGSSFLAERLSEQGVVPGAELALNGFTFNWPDAAPGTPDNVAAAGQTIGVTGTGNTLALLGTGTSGSAGGTVTLHFSDGTAATASTGFPNWCCLASDTYGATIAVKTLGKNTPTGPAYPTVEYRLYTSTVPIPDGKELVAVTLPQNAAIHVFSLAVGEEDRVPPPVPDGQYALTNAGNSLALQAPGTAAQQLTTAAASTAASQKWILTHSLQDGSYQIRNAGSGLCVDVFSSSRTSGAVVGQYTCTGNDNQKFAIAVVDGQLQITARHSGLTLAVDGGGLVVQSTDDGTAAQRWTAAQS